MDNPLWCQLCDADEEATCADWCPRRSISEQTCTIEHCPCNGTPLGATIWHGP